LPELRLPATRRVDKVSPVMKAIPCFSI